MIVSVVSLVCVDVSSVQDTAAVPALTSVLVDLSEAAIVRHEAAEALGAIGAEESLAMLEKFCEDDKREVAETCRLAVSRLRWKKGREEELHLDDNMYRSGRGQLFMRFN